MFLIEVKKGKGKDKEKEQKKAKKKLVALLRKLKKAHEKYEEIQDIVDKLDSIFREYEEYLPSDVKKHLQDVTKLSDNTPESIKNTFDSLKSALEFAKDTLPGTIVPASAIAGIAAVVAVASIATGAYFMMMVDVEISNVGCSPIIVEGIPTIPTDQTITIQVPNIQASIDGTTAGIVRIENQLMPIQIPVPQEIRDIQFDDTSIIGSTIYVDLSTRDKHYLVISCR